MSKRDIDRMTRDEALAWFSGASDEDLAEAIRTAQRVRDEEPPVPAPIPLMLTSIRLPVELVLALDEVAATEGLNRSESIRAAVTAYVDERRGGTGVAEAERALEVLRRVVSEHAHGRAA